ncbi:senescence-associated carboxylesterase 101-like isoform X1 [Prosopis cineraria]|uniref:senescence-associated carboxylesterase 101-like isoform X1 n=1 Tax=Prosopis cineraria TaxID=364024 RepID=UPI00240FC844|nr:senescence-associated carboxylesterase 101-like isoform X1 [Prosopis cineraria]
MMNPNQAQVFTGGLESASSVVSSGILSSLWELISSESTHSSEALFWKDVSKEPGSTIILFGTAQNTVEPELLTLSNDDDNPFKFICSKTYPTFSLDKSTFSLFNAYRNKLDQLKSKINLQNSVFLTGYAVGGSIASLFTLLLLEKMDPKQKHPLCITFGSPLIGDQKFQQAISRSSNWNSCFLHVASLRDPFLSYSISHNSYSPFGIFFLCSDYGSACFESPVSVLKLLNHMTQLNQEFQNPDYGNIVKNLNRKAICKDTDDGPNIPHSDILEESLALQLCALGFSQFLREVDLKNLVKELKYQEVQLTLKKTKRFVLFKKLDDMKVYMAKLEWYKKHTKKDKYGYYDSYKEEIFPYDLDVVLYRKKLNKYWEQVVEEVEKQPMKEAAAFLRTRWLYSGNIYRKMVQPLDIAHYYKEGNRDYINCGRSEHYKLLEKWFDSDRLKHDESMDRKNVESILTSDSCFWARVEEAVILTQKLKAGDQFTEAEKQEAMNSLDEFEKYVYGLLKNYAVSPEIFLEKSSFMCWWRDYIKIKGIKSHDSELFNLMSNHDEYEKGAYDFPQETKLLN